MILTITIDTANAAFHDDNTEAEVVNILNRFSRWISREGLSQRHVLMDTNGHKVGYAAYDEA